MTATACALFSLTFAAGTLLAQNAGTVTIFSNLGPSSTNLYFHGTKSDDIIGYCFVGTSNPAPERCKRAPTGIALPFTPTKNSHATMLQAAIGLIAGTNQFQLALFNDNNGVPGTALATVTINNAPPANTCCQLVTANLGTPGIALTANTQYWVVAMSDANFAGQWAFTNFAFNGAFTAEFGWGSVQEFGAAAGAVRGTIP
jgi:hypothetical protein